MDGKYFECFLEKNFLVGGWLNGNLIIIWSLTAVVEVLSEIVIGDDEL